MLCNCGHRIKEHHENHQCSKCPCPIVVMVTYKEAMEWRIFPWQKLKDENVNPESVNNYDR